MYSAQTNLFSYDLVPLSSGTPFLLCPPPAGGTTFATTALTLSREAPTFLSAAAGGDFPEDDVLFVDRDPTHFPAILQYLRGEPQ